MRRSRLVRSNAGHIRWMRATAFAVVTIVVLIATHFFPPLIGLALGVAVGAVALYSASLASMLLVTVCALPVVAADFVSGILFLVVGFGATQYLGDHEARGFVVVMLAALAVAFHAEWAVVVLAGYLLGSGQGAVAAVVSCLLIELAGIMLGRPVLGSLVTGGTAPGVLDFTSMPADALTFSWIGDSFASIDTARVIDAITGAHDLVLLAAQAAVWGAAAAAAGIFHRPDHRRTSLVMGGIAVVVLALAGVGAILSGMATAAVPIPTIAVTALVSLVLTTASVWLTERYFPLRAPAAAAVAHGVRVEDADVDELLSTIASAEQALTSRHTTHAVVMITDMKSFSAMTEDIGSIESAKLVQRHRDVLLPVIDAHGGAGKSTGGDGLVAAFQTAEQAVAAAQQMQATLAASDMGGIGVSIRIGIAQGEVVLDKGGRPFIGAALNQAARVMDLADGGRIIAEASVARHAGTSAIHDHGMFKLKNIQDPVRVFEVLWAQDMSPGSLRGERIEAENSDDPGR